MQRLGIIFAFSTVAMVYARKLSSMQESVGRMGARLCCVYWAGSIFAESVRDATGSVCLFFRTMVLLLLRAMGVRPRLAYDGQWLRLACDGVLLPFAGNKHLVCFATFVRR